MKDCIFCKIIANEIPCYKIYEDSNTLAFLDISKDCYGHTLVIPKTHHKNIFEIDQQSLSHLIKTTKLVCDHYKSLGFDGVNIITNNDESAEQSIPHIHFHIIPRKENDNLRIFPNLKPQEFNLDEIQKKLCIKNCH